MVTPLSAASQKVFRAKAPGIMQQLMRDFDLGVEDAAAIMGNLGQESAGLTAFQETAPTVKGSRGGYGWAQWTGPRRVAYEAYCKRNGKDPKSDDANYGYLFVELKGIEGSEKAAIPALKKAKTLAEKVKAFERGFLRAGTPNYPRRNEWAAIALDAYAKAPPAPSAETVTVLVPTGEPSTHTPPPPAGNGRLLAVIGSVVLAVLTAAGSIIHHLFTGG